MTIEDDLLPHLRRLAEQHPEAAGYLQGLYELAVGEVEDDESEHDEVEKAISAADEWVKEHVATRYNASS